MAWITLYPGKAGSPIATLTSPIDDDDTTIPVSNTEHFSTGPGIAVLFDDDGNMETVVFTDKSTSSGTGNLQTCTRAEQGTARSWDSGTQIARLFTALDFDSLRQNLEFFLDAITSPGSSGQVLTSRGSGSTPTFQDAPAGGITEWSADVSFTRASDTSFTVTDNATNQAIFRAGRPIRYSDDGSSWVYGIVISYSSGTVTLAGAPMTTSYDAHLQYASMEKVIPVNILIPGWYEDMTNHGLVIADLGFTHIWKQGKAYCVQICASTRVKDSGATAVKVNACICTHQGIAQAGAAGTVTLSAQASSSDDYYTDLYVAIIEGTGSGQIRQISDYVGSTKIATVNSNWTTNPDTTSGYVILKGNPESTTGLCTTTGGLTLTHPFQLYESTSDINTSIYQINPGEKIEVSSVKGTNGDAQDLSITLTFVLG